MKVNRATDVRSIPEPKGTNEPRDLGKIDTPAALQPMEDKGTTKNAHSSPKDTSSDITILNEFIRSDEYLLLEKVNKYRKSFGSKPAETLQEMPRTDHVGTTNNAMNGQQKLRSNMTLADWDLLQIFYKNAILLDEIKKLDSRRSQLLKIEKHDKEISALRDDFFMQAKILGQIRDRALLNHIYATKRIDEKIEFSQVEKKLDKKAFIQKRAEFEHFLHLIGFKLGYLPLPRLQRHIVEDGHGDRVRFMHAKLENLRNRDFEASKASTEALLAAGQLAYKIAHTQRNVAYFKAEDNVLALNTQIQAQIILQYELYMGSKGYTAGWLPRPAKARELEKQGDIPPEVEHQRKLAKIDEKALINHWMETKQFLKGKNDDHELLNAMLRRGEDRHEQILTGLRTDSQLLKLKLFDDARTQIEEFIATNILAKKQEKTQKEQLQKSDKESLLHDEDQELKHDIREFENYMRSNGYNPDGIPLPEKQRDLENQLKSGEENREKSEQLKITDLTETRQKMAQLRAASEFVLQEAAHNARIQGAKENTQVTPNLTQRIKAAK